MSQVGTQSTLEGDPKDASPDKTEQLDESQTQLVDEGASPDQPARTEHYSETTERKAQSDAGDGTENLDEFGVDEDPRPNKPKLDNPDGELKADRRTNRRGSGKNLEQEQLFPDVDNEDQLTLGGEKAYNQCKFG